MIWATFVEEEKYWAKGYKYIVGMDEVGRGSWAGPVVTAGVIFKSDDLPTYQVADSKLLKADKRRALSLDILSHAHATAVCEVPVAIINKVGVGKATQICFRKTLSSLKDRFDFVFIDAFYVQNIARSKQMAIKGGDKISASIAAASIIAKVHRDELMTSMHATYPLYGFDKHVGYGTKMHQKALSDCGFCPEHRMSFNLASFAQKKG